MKKTCWRCQAPLVRGGAGLPYPAAVNIRMADNSFCGLFKIDLCGACAREPHCSKRQQLRVVTGHFDVEVWR